MPIQLIDCFIFYNELDLLTYRMNILNNIVDYFIIVESTHTHTGKEKPLFFNQNKHLFKQFKDKIIHIIVDDFPHKFPNINCDNNDQWINEKFQRNAIPRGFNYINNLNPDDLIIISDLDEIPDPNTLNNVKKGDIKVDFAILEMDLYYYNLNTQYTTKWHHSKIISYKKYKHLNLTCDNIRLHQYSQWVNTITNGGWHLSYFGDVNFIKNKIMNFAHQELNNDNYTDLSKIEERVNNTRDLYDRSDNPTRIEIIDNIYLPFEYNIWLTKYFN